MGCKTYKNLAETPENFFKSKVRVGRQLDVSQNYHYEHLFGFMVYLLMKGNSYLRTGINETFKP
jgi:hypothetical protein